MQFWSATNLLTVKIVQLFQSITFRTITDTHCSLHYFYVCHNSLKTLNISKQTTKIYVPTHDFNVINHKTKRIRLPIVRVSSSSLRNIINRQLKIIKRPGNLLNYTKQSTFEFNSEQYVFYTCWNMSFKQYLSLSQEFTQRITL